MQFCIFQCWNIIFISQFNMQRLLRFLKVDFLKRITTCETLLCLLVHPNMSISDSKKGLRKIRTLICNSNRFVLIYWPSHRILRQSVAWICVEFFTPYQYAPHSKCFHAFSFYGNLMGQKVWNMKMKIKWNRSTRVQNAHNCSQITCKV